MGSPYDLRHVTSVEQRLDDTVLVLVQTDSFKPGQEVEVSVYLTQDNGYYGSFNGKMDIPLVNDPAVLRVNLPAMDLDAGRPVTAVARVTEAWPTVLQPDSEIMADQGVKARWTYHDPQGESSGDT